MIKNYIAPESFIDTMNVSDEMLQTSTPDVSVNPDATEVYEVDSREGFSNQSIWDDED